MNPQIALFDQAYNLLINAAEAQAVLRYLEIKCPRADGLYDWIRAACWSQFDFESEALADQYRDVLDQSETGEATNA